MSELFYQLLAEGVITNMLIGTVHTVKDDGLIDVKFKDMTIPMQDSPNTVIKNYVAKNILVAQPFGVMYIKPLVGTKVLVAKVPNALYEIFNQDTTFNVKVSPNGLAFPISAFNTAYKNIPADFYVSADLSVFGNAGVADFVASADKVDGRLLTLVLKINTMVAAINSLIAGSPGIPLSTQAFLTSTAVETLKAS